MVLTYDLLEERRIDDETINSILSFMCKSSGIDVVVGLYNKESGKTAVCGTFFVLTTF